MLEQMMRYCRNFFIVDSHSGRYEIKSGMVNLPFLKNEQYYMIEGSIFNDGVHKYPEHLVDEEFNGYVHAMAVPDAFLRLVAEVEAWMDKNKDAMDSPYSSESFGGYTYSKGDGTADSWKKIFASRLNVWRKL